MHAHPTHRQSFYLYRRSRKNIKPYWYYKVLGPDWETLIDRSTHRLNKHDAYLYCLELEQQDRLLEPISTDKVSSTTRWRLSEYFSDWFIWEKGKDPVCPYIQRKLKKGKSFSIGHASIQRGNLTKYIFPQFGNRSIKTLTTAEIDEWLFDLPEERGISNRTANNIFATLRLMLGEARRLGHIKSNPALEIETLGLDQRKRDILRWDEVDDLFHKASWGSQVARVGNILAACTGMRRGEIRALQRASIQPDKIIVNYALDGMFDVLKLPKNQHVREIPITQELYELLLSVNGNREGFIFSFDGGKTPVTANYFRDYFIKALENIKIDRKIQKERNLVFHGWRIFLNTLLQVNGMPDVKVRGIIGHLTSEMMVHYTNVPIEAYKTDKLMSIFDIQRRIVQEK